MKLEYCESCHKIIGGNKSKKFKKKNSKKLCDKCKMKYRDENKLKVIMR